MEYVLKAGMLAFYDTIGSGLVPIKVLAIGKDGDDLTARVKVTATRKAYHAGEVLNIRPRLNVVARDQVYVRSGHFRIRGRTEFIVG